jgi:HEPN domain-containing protein
MHCEEKISYWLKSAESDLSASKALIDNKSYLQMSFFCHLVVEKSLKAYHWYKLQVEPPYTHNLLKLTKDTALFDLLSQEQKEFIASLIPLNLKGRYPDDEDTILSNLSQADLPAL